MHMHNSVHTNMYRSCICFTLLLALSSGLQLEEFAQGTDYSSFFDLVLASIKGKYPPTVRGPPLNLDVTEKSNSSEPVASFSGPNCYIGNFHTLKRTSPVDAYLSSGSLTLSTDVSFGNLQVSYNESTIAILGQNFEISAKLAVNRNQFRLTFTLTSNSNGSCVVRVTDARFTAINDVSVVFTPLGFFNQVSLNAKINYLVKSVLDKFNDINKALLGQILQNEFCSQFSH